MPPSLCHSESTEASESVATESSGSAPRVALQELNAAELNMLPPRQSKRQRENVSSADGADNVVLQDSNAAELNVLLPRRSKRQRVNVSIADRAEKCSHCKHVLSVELFREGAKEFRTCLHCRERVCNLFHS